VLTHSLTVIPAKEARMMDLGRNWPRSVALIVMAAAAAIWLWFGIGSAAYERLGVVNWVMHLLFPGGLFVLLTALAWRRPQIGVRCWQSWACWAWPLCCASSPTGSCCAQRPR
jgi:hypothetical protein